MPPRLAVKIDNPDPIWIRDTLVEDTIENARARGQDLPALEVERIITHDLQLSDVFDREHSAKPRADAPPKIRSTDPAGDIARELSEERGQDVSSFRLALIPGRAKAREQLRCPCGACRACKMSSRMRILMRRLPGTRLAKSDGCLDWTACVYPAWARECTALMQDYSQRCGRFAGRPQAECDRMVVRLMEDLCDRSDSIIGLGNWWVK